MHRGQFVQVFCNYDPMIQEKGSLNKETARFVSLSLAKH